MVKFLTINEFELKGKLIAIRLDINSPLIKDKIILNERIEEGANSIRELIERGAKIIVLAHQGRKGKSDCKSLKEHVLFLEKLLKKKIDFEDDLYNSKIKEKISKLKEGDVLVLENLRFFDDETNFEKKDNKLLKLESLLDFYIFDAFSVSHREQVSVTGFKKVPIIAGPLMEKELKGLSNIEDAKSPHIFVFGGAKPDDLLDLMEISLKEKSVDLILLSGVIGELALYLKGVYIGKKLDFLNEHDMMAKLPILKTLMKKYPGKIETPLDFAIEKDGKRFEIKVSESFKYKDLLDNNLIQDIGSKTISYYKTLLKSASTIYYKGPAGNFEETNFDYGTKMMLENITKTKAFTYMGGGHSVTSAKMYGFLDKFSYVSLAGGALVTFISQKTLAGIKVLENSEKLNERVFEDFVVLGSNVIDLTLSIDKHYSEVHLGSKIRVSENFSNTLGGGGVNVSIALSRLGGKVGYLGKISESDETFIKEILNKNRVNIIKSKLSKRPSAKSIILDFKDDDRIIFTHRGQNPYLDIKDFNPDSFRSNAYYFNSLTGDSFNTMLELTKIIRGRNPKAKICYNPSLYIIPKEKKLKNLIKNIDILILNFEEAQELSKKESLIDCLKSLKEMGPELIIITDGKNGAYAYNGKRETFVPAYKAKKIVDTTGAGDAFAATFFYFYSKGFSIKKSLNYAAINSSSVLEKVGAQEGLLYYEDLIKR